MKTSVADARVLAAEDARNAHRALGRADHQVAVGERALHAVERHERGAFGAVSDHDAAALDLRGIERVEGLSEFEQHEVGDVHQVVLGVDARGAQAVLHPLGRGADLAARDRDARIAGCRLGVFDRDADFEGVVVGPEVRHVGHAHFDLLAAAAQVGRQVARHADVRRGVGTVGRQSDADQVVVLDAEVFAGRHAHGRIGRELHDAVVGGADAQLVLGAEHAERLHAADFAALDLELLVAPVGVEHGAHRGAQHLEARAAVGGAAHDAQRLGAARVHGGDVEVVRIGVVGAREHLAHYDAPQAALHGFHLFEALDFEPYVGQNLCELLCRAVGGQIAPEPVVGDIHIGRFYIVLATNRKDTKSRAQKQTKFDYAETKYLR